MRAIVRIVNTEDFLDTVTSFVGPFASCEEAGEYVAELEAYHGGEAEFYVEDLYEPTWVE